MARMRHPASTTSSWSLWDSLCEHVDIVFLLATNFLSPTELIRMYCISKNFNFLVDSHRCKFVQASARKWARLRHALSQPTGDRCVTLNNLDHGLFKQTPDQDSSTLEILSLFKPALYPKLCDTDPTCKTPIGGLPRRVPSLRYLLFLTHRCSTIHSIIQELALKGHRLPCSVSPVLAKIWLLMDVPTNKYRLALIHNKTYWTDDDLRLATLFFIKLDMAFQDPLSNEGRSVLRPLSLAQRSLVTLAQILKRKEARTPLEISRLYLRWKHRPSAEHQHFSILGIPPEEMGKLELEGWGLSNEYWASQRPIDIVSYLKTRARANDGRQSPGSELSPLRLDPDRPFDVEDATNMAQNLLPAGRERQVLLRPDQLVMRECILRNLKIDKLLVHMIRWGFIDHSKFVNYQAYPANMEHN